MSTLLNFFRSLFTVAHAENNSTVETTPTTNVVTVVDTQVPEYVDILGNELHVGDHVVNITYNEKNRRGYLSIKNDFIPYAFSATNNCKVIKHDVLLTLMNSDKVKASRKSGYLHVVTA